jgi:hypothetical protein
MLRQNVKEDESEKRLKNKNDMVHVVKIKMRWYILWSYGLRLLVYTISDNDGTHGTDGIRLIKMEHMVQMVYVL